MPVHMAVQVLSRKRRHFAENVIDLTLDEENAQPPGTHRLLYDERVSGDGWRREGDVCVLIDDDDDARSEEPVADIPLTRTQLPKVAPPRAGTSVPKRRVAEVPAHASEILVSRNASATASRTPSHTRSITSNIIVGPNTPRKPLACAETSARDIRPVSSWAPITDDLPIFNSEYKRRAKPQPAQTIQLPTPPTSTSPAQVLSRLPSPALDDGRWRPFPLLGSQKPACSLPQRIASPLFQLPVKTPAPARAVQRCELRKCRMGYGLHATAPVKRGERVISERPFIRFDFSEHGCRRSRVNRLVDALTGVDRALFYTFTRRGGHENLEVDICQTNGIPLQSPIVELPHRTALEDDHDRTDSESDADDDCGGVFEHISRINHSCTPNAVWTWDADSGKMSEWDSAAVRLSVQSSELSWMLQRIRRSPARILTRRLYPHNSAQKPSQDFRSNAAVHSAAHRKQSSPGQTRSWRTLIVVASCGGQMRPGKGI